MVDDYEKLFLRPLVAVACGQKDYKSFLKSIWQKETTVGSQQGHEISCGWVDYTAISSLK